MARAFVLIGTGTSVGKTHVAERLLRGVAAAGEAGLGYKPIESGVSGLEGSDIARLASASTFHVKPPLHSETFRTPVSAHLAARLEGRTIDLERVRSEIQRGAASSAAIFLVELPGGAFSPFTAELTGAAFARSLPGIRALLVTVDRLGVLHDVAATALACAAIGLPLHGIVLNAAAHDDTPPGSNEEALPLVTTVPVLARLPRQPGEAPIAAQDPVRDLVRSLLT
jgi:dethiobiotin synthetase